MDVRLDPAVLRKLAAFARRRRRLTWTRALAAGVLVFVVGVALAIAVDWFVLLTDRSRLLISFGVYASAIFTTVTILLSRLGRTPSAEAEIAAQLEADAPALRENLRAAVELAADRPEDVHDSPVFRALLQRDVATKVADVHVGRLLPFRLIAKPVAAAVILLLAGLAAGLLGGDTTQRLIARTVLPGANIARVSRVQIDIVEPSPASLTLATADTISIVAAVSDDELSGGSITEATLETEAAGDRVSRAMTRRSGDRFAANVLLGETALRYRVRAGDAITKWFTIDTQQRPHVVGFAVVYDPPAYARRPKYDGDAESGDLVALTGSTAELTITLDQQIAEGRLLVSSGDDDNAKPLELFGTADPLVHRALVPMQSSGTYEIALVAARSGLRNIYAPTYEIRALPDLIPRVQMTAAWEGDLLLSPSDLLDLTARVDDDLPIESLEQLVRVNGGRWTREPITLPEPVHSGGEYTTGAAWPWDLQAISARLPAPLQTGDVLETRLIATDRRGNVGETATYRVRIASKGFSANRHDAVFTKLSIQRRLDELVAWFETTQPRIDSRLDDISEEASREAALTELSRLVAEHNRLTESILDEAVAVLPAIENGIDGLDVALTAESLAVLRHRFGGELTLAAAELGLDDGDVRTKPFRDAFGASRSGAEEVATRYRILTSHNVAFALHSDLASLSRQQEEVVRLAEDDSNGERFVRMQASVNEQLKSFERFLQSTEPLTTSSLQREMKWLLEWSAGNRVRLAEANEAERPERRVQVARDLRRELGDRQRVDLVGNASQQAVDARRKLDRRIPPLTASISEAAGSLRELEETIAGLASAGDSHSAESIRDERDDIVRRLGLAHADDLRRVAVSRSVEQASPIGSTLRASDDGLTVRALEAVLAAGLASPSETVGANEATPVVAMGEIATAYATLQAGHEALDMQRLLTDLIERERHDAPSLIGRFDHPRQWDLIVRRYDAARDRLADQRFDNDLLDELNAARWSPEAQKTQQKLSDRRWQSSDFASAERELIGLRDRFATPIARLDEPMRAARETIRQYVPSIERLATEAAEQARRLAEQTADSQASQQRDELAQSQQSLSEQLADLFEALADEANAQSILDEQQRERARDADLARELIRDAAETAADAMSEAMDASTDTAAEQPFAEASAAQAQTADTLEKVAEHFEGLASGDDASATRQQLRQMADRQGVSETVEQQFADVDDLVQQANKSPENLLEELEAELAVNPQMREALDDIAKAATDDAVATLKDAAETERDIRSANERSDGSLQATKREAAKSLQQTARDLQQTTQQLVNRAREAAARGQDTDAAEQLHQAQQQLQDAARKAAAANENTPLQELGQLARDTAEQLESAAESLAGAEQQARESQDKDAFSDKDKARKRSEEERAQRSIRDQLKRQAESAARKAESNQRRAKDDLARAERELDRARDNLKSAEKRLAEKPDDRSRQNKVDQEAARVDRETQKRETAKANAEATKQAAEAAKKAMEIEKTKPRPSLTKPNPSAQLARELAADAQQRAQEAARAASELARQLGQAEPVTPTGRELARSAGRQLGVGEEVEAAAEALDRVARHQERLNQSIAAGESNELAAAARAVVDGESTDAQRKLEEAASEAEAAGEADSKADPKNAAAAQSAVEEAERKIGELAATIAGQTGSSSNEPSQGTQDELARGRELAELLDQLDRQQNGSPASLPAAETPTGEQSAAAAEGTPATAGKGEASTGQTSMFAAEAARAESQMAAARAQATQQAQQAIAAASAENGQPSDEASMAAGGEASDGFSDPDAEVDAFDLVRVDRGGDEWGALRKRSAEDVTSARGEVVAEDYRESVDAYFRVLAERAKQKDETP